LRPHRAAVYDPLAKGEEETMVRQHKLARRDKMVLGVVVLFLATLPFALDWLRSTAGIVGLFAAVAAIIWAIWRAC